MTDIAPTLPRLGWSNAHTALGGSGDSREGRHWFERELIAHCSALYAFGKKLTAAPDDAEDLVSETTLRALERWRQFQPGTNLRAWLFTILYRVFVSRRRRTQAREVLAADEPKDAPARDAIGEGDPERTYFDSFIDEGVLKSLRRLPSEYKSVVVMSDVRGMSYAEIAKSLGVPEGTVKSRLFRGRRLLQGPLRSYAKEMGYLSRKASLTSRSAR